MDLFPQKCVRCGRRTQHRFENRPTCEPCVKQIELMLAATREQARSCPIDGTPMLKAVAHMMVIDRCPACHGVWLDSGELEHMKEDVAREAMIAVARGYMPAS